MHCSIFHGKNPEYLVRIRRIYKESTLSQLHKTIHDTVALLDRLCCIIAAYRDDVNVLSIFYSHNFPFKTKRIKK